MNNDSEQDVNIGVKYEQDCEEWLSAQEAATRLGISKRAVLLRIQRGKIVHKREGDRFLVCLDAIEGTGETAHEQDGEQTTNNGVKHGESLHGELFTQMQADIDFLRSQLQQRDVAESEFRRLLLSRDMEIVRLQERVQMLLAAPSNEDTPVSPQDSQETRSAKVEANAENMPPTQETGRTEAQSVKRAWWKFWERNGP